MATSGIVGRAAELVSIESFLAGVERAPAALILTGEAGIGKTALWEWGVEEAERRFGRVLSCRGVEAETGLSFAGLSDLLTEALDEVADGLIPVRRRALEVALLLAEPGEEPPDARAIGIAVLDVLQLSAETRPVVIAVDDLQWLDAASVGALQLALRRLRNERVGLLATVLDAPTVRMPFELERSLPGATELSLGPLGAGELHQLLKDRLELELSRPELARIREATAGNPFFVLELGRELARDGSRPGPGSLHIPDGLRTLLGRRLDLLPPDTRDTLLVVAAAGSPTADVVATAHGNAEQALEALEVAAREGVVVLDGSRVRFAHPLLSSLTYAAAPEWRRRAVHRALAQVVADIEERSRHLALATDGPDAAVASTLDEAAAHAAARGATAAAAELAEMAAALTPAGHEADGRRRRLVAGWFHRLAGDFDRASATLEELLDDIPDGVERSDVLYALATTGRADIPTRIRLCEEALQEAPGDDVREAKILGFLAINRWHHGDVPRALRDARAGAERAEQVGDPGLLATALGRVGLVETYALEMTPGLLERAVALEDTLARVRVFHDSATVMLAIRLALTDELDRGRAILEAADRDAESRGDEHSHAFAARILIYFEWFAGRWQRALEHAAVAAEFAEQTHDPQFAGAAAAARARLETDLGLVDRARASAEAGLAWSREAGDEIYVIFNLAALGCVEVALDNLRGAADHFRDLPERLIAAGHRMPGPLDFWPDAIETLIALGDLGTARERLDAYEGLAQLASRRAVGCAARCRGMLAAADGDPPAALAAFEEALARPDALHPLDRGRTLLALGSARRQARQKRPAREALEQALGIFEQLGAPVWAERARQELGRISGRRPASGELSETEQRVAALVAEGRSNKEVAAELYMSVRTVEAHLSRVYAKLDIRSRAALTRRVLSPAESEANTADNASNVP